MTIPVPRLKMEVHEWEVHVVRTRLVRVAFLIALALAACRGSGGAQALDDIGRLAAREGVPESSLRLALTDAAERAGTSADDVARRWLDDATDPVIPRVDDVMVDDLTRQHELSRDFAVGVVCDVASDALARQTMPSSDDIWGYVYDNLVGVIPGQDAAALAEEVVDILATAQSDGDQAVVEGRLLLLKIRYC